MIYIFRAFTYHLPGSERMSQEGSRCQMIYFCRPFVVMRVHITHTTQNKYNYKKKHQELNKLCWVKEQGRKSNLALNEGPCCVVKPEVGVQRFA